MQTKLHDSIKNSPEGEEAEAILRSCVHCGFCLSVCPTYQLLGDELDSPRGRIYLLKQMLEGQPVTEKTQMHLDRCLTCRACETACPSGVRYARLADIGRNMLEKQVGRGIMARAKRYMLRRVIPDARVFGSLFRLGQRVKPLLPASMRNTLPPPPFAGNSQLQPPVRHTRRMLILEGCAQPTLAPNINAAAARVLDTLGISLIRASGAGCCGAVSYHLNAQQEGLDYMRRNIDAWWPWLDAGRDGSGVEAIVITASGCGVTVREYGELLKHDPVYAAKAARISSLTRDISEVIEAGADRLAALVSSSTHRREGQSAMPLIAFHSPCTLQHGMRIRNVVEKILAVTGFDLTFVPDAHLCCGSAGTYSILQPELSGQLLKNKVAALESGKPACIVTANIGCLSHLQGGTSLPVRHWIELVDDVLSGLPDK